MQLNDVNSTAPAAPMFAFSKAAATAPVKPKPDLVSFLQQLGYQQYAVPLACAGFPSMPELSLINAPALKKCGVLDGLALRIVDALKKRKACPSPPARTGPGAADFMHHRKKRMGEARSLSFVCCATFMLVNHPEPPRKQQQPSTAHQETPATIHSPPRNTSNHPQPTKKQQQPSTAPQETPATIHSPPRNNSNHPEPTRKHQEPSKAHEEMIVTI